MIAPRRIILAVAMMLGAISVVAGIVFLVRPREPRYQDKTLSEWIVPFCSQSSTGLFMPSGPQYFELLQPVRHAVSEINTNGVPYLMAKLSRKEPGWHRKLRELAKQHPIAFLRFTDPHASKIRAIRALAVLGPRARPAIPLLAAQLPNPMLSDHAVYALSAMGAEGFRALIDHFTNAAPAGQMVAAITLSTPGSYYRGENSTYAETNGITPELLVEGLSRVIDSSRFRAPAIGRLSSMGPPASNAIPALLTALNGSGMDRQIAVRALANISPPNLAISTLTNLLEDPDLGVQIAARAELSRLGYRGLTAPIMGRDFARGGPPFTPGMPERRIIPSPGIGSRAQSTSPFSAASTTAQPAGPSNRVLLKLPEVNLTTNFVVGKVEAQGDLPDRIAVMVKALKNPEPGDVDFGADHPRGTNVAAIVEFGRKWNDQQKARHADESVDWSQANWMPFTNSVAIDLGPGEGRRLVWLMGMWTSANGSSRRGNGTHVRVDHTPPVIVLTKPEERVVSKPMILLQGYSPECIGDICYEIVNGSNQIAGEAYVFDQHHDMRIGEITTNQFKSNPIRLTPGTNDLYLRCKDASGNRSTNHYAFVYIPNQSNQPPRISIESPRDGMQVSRNGFMVSGFVDDPDAHMTCVTATAQGTNRFDASVARNGFFSFSDARLQSGTNRLTVIATSDAGNPSETNLVVYQKP